MFIAEVIGAVVTTHKPDNMEGLSLRLVRKITPEGEVSETYSVAVDVAGADVGEYVLVTAGSAARQTASTDNRPVDAVIMAIVDTWHIHDFVKYEKHPA